MFTRALMMVTQFIRRRNIRRTPFHKIKSDVLVSYAGKMVSEVCEEKWKMDNPIHLRAALLCEELGEFLTAMAQCDEIGMCDGLGDLLYVVLGTAVQLEIPIDEIFEEIHYSNMTKHVDSDDPRVNNKGDGYRFPDLLPIIEAAKKAEHYGDVGFALWLANREHRGTDDARRSPSHPGGSPTKAGLRETGSITASKKPLRDD